MKNLIRKVLLRLFAFVAVCFVVVVGSVLNPSLLYAHTTEVEGGTIYHNKPLPQEFVTRLQESISIISQADVYDPNYKLDMCLNDGSIYPTIVEKIKGAGFGHGFYNKVVITSEIDCAKNKATIYGKKWNFSQLVAHEMIHCHQFNTYGWSTLKFPLWKLEGYPEVISREDEGESAMLQHLATLQHMQETNNNWVVFEDGTGCPLNYYQHRLSIYYLMKIKGLSYDQIVAMSFTEDAASKDMNKWYQEKQ